MAFRALVCSQKSETNAAMAAACKGAGIRAEVCADIFSAIEKGKTQAYSCVIVDWADQPEASFLLRRARESVANRNTVVVAVVDREPTAAEVRDNRLDFLINRPIAAEAARAVLAKASEKMQPSSAGDDEDSPAGADTSPKANAAPAAEPEHSHRQMFPEEDAAPESGGDVAADGNTGENDESKDRPRSYSFARVARGVLAAIVILAAVFCLWRSHETIEYLSRTREGRLQVLREAVAAFFYWNNGAASPVGAAGNDARQDEYFSRGPASSEVRPPALGVVSTESNLPDARMPLPKAPDLPLPVAALERQEPALTIRRERAAIPESMRSSPPIAPPVVVTVNAAQMMPVSAPQPAPPSADQFSEPVALSEELARALLVHTVNPVYPAAALAQKLHGPVVLQTVIGRDGSVEDLKIVRGNFILVQAAIAAVKQWRFQPYTINGHAAATQTVITINFSYPPG